MYLFDFFRSFLPLRNPLGFGASDFVELVLAAWLVFLALASSAGERSLRRLAEKTVPSMLLLACGTAALRLLLLPHSPVPTASGADDFSYLLLGDTLSHGRLANPAHPLQQFFETIFVLSQPSYSSIYPLGQGIALAFGQVVLRNPWLGVLLSVSLLPALCYWMLRAWTTPLWALLGGLLAVIEFGPLSPWMNSYWGGALSGVAGCLVFGALPRLRTRATPGGAALLGGGIGLEILTRPFEAVLLVGSVLLFFSPLLPGLRAASGRRSLAKCSAVALACLTPALLLTALQNRAITGSWTTLPYMASRYQYGVPASFTVEPNPVPHRELTPQQELDYRAQSAIHGEGTDTIERYFERLAFRVRYYRFFFLPPLYLGALLFLSKLREWRFVWVLAALALFSLGTNFYPYFYPHYIAAVTCLCALVGIEGLRWLARVRIGHWPAGKRASQCLLLVCAAQFLFWYGIHFIGAEELWPILRYETWDFINYGDPEGRIAINHTLESSGGKQLVFVRYGPQHRFEEWIHNRADIDRSRVVWARDLGRAQNGKLIAYFRDRKVWLLEPDAQPARLSAYDAETTSRP